MTTQAIDSTFPPNPDALRRLAIGGVIRYIGRFRKATSRAEVAALRAAAFVLGFVFESTATRALAGYAAGMADALAANAAADDLGVPLTVALVWAVDTSARPSDVLPYGRGWHAASKRPAGVYGSAGVIDACFDAGLVVEGWQTNAHGWDNPRRTSAHASIRQGLPAKLPGVGYVDPDEIDDGSRLVWWPAGHPGTPATPTPWHAPVWPGHLLRPGDTSHDVAVWAIMLRVAGYQLFNLRGSSAEVFGAGKRRATIRFQKNHGLHADGIVGPITWAKMDEVLTKLHGHALAA